MDRLEAERRFQKADKLFTYGRYEDAMADLDALDSAFPDNHRVLNAKVRTLEQLQRYDLAVALCKRLVDDLGYEKARTMKERLEEAATRAGTAPQEAFWSNTAPPPTAPPLPDNAAEAPAARSTEAPAKRRFKLKPLRLIILIGLVGGMYLDQIPLWLGCGLIGAYFFIKYVLIGLIGKWFMFKIFTAPLKMKGKALAGATCHLHGFEWTEKPASVAKEDADEDDPKPFRPLRYVWLDVSIIPEERTEGFTHWEPGELALAPAALKYTGLDDMEKCFSVHEVKLVIDGPDADDEGVKYHGPQRLKLLFGIPMDQNTFNFVYYFEQFGEVRVAG